MKNREGQLALPCSKSKVYNLNSTVVLNGYIGQWNRIERSVWNTLGNVLYDKGNISNQWGKGRIFQ